MPKAIELDARSILIDISIGYLFCFLYLYREKINSKPSAFRFNELCTLEVVQFRGIVCLTLIEK